MRGGRTIINSKPTSFNSTWKTDNTSAGSSAANQIRIPAKPSVSINFGSIQYTVAASSSRAILISAPNNWTIVDGGQV